MKSGLASIFTETGNARNETPSSIPWPEGFSTAIHRVSAFDVREEIRDAHHFLVYLGRPEVVRERRRFRTEESLIPHEHFAIWRIGDRFDVSSPNPLHFFRLSIEPVFFHEMFPGLDDIRFFQRRNFPDDQAIRLARRAIQMEAARGSLGSLETESLSAHFALHLAERHARNPRDLLKARLSSGQLRKVSQFIVENLERTFSLDDLAREANVSRFHFSRLFQKTMGQSPWQFVLRHKLERGWCLLRESSRPISDIALGLGFSDQAHFTRHFRRRFGRTPLSVRGR